MRAAGLFLLFCGAAVAAPVPKAIRKTDFYPSAVGNRWVYTNDDGTNEHTREVTASSTKDGVTDFTITWKQGASTQTWEMRKDADGVVRVKQNGTAFDPPQLLVKAKMDAADEWETEYTFGTAGKYKHRRTVGKAEVLKVPAGEYTAVPITSVSLDGSELETSLWYADGVGLLKIHAKDGTPIVLKEFAPAKK